MTAKQRLVKELESKIEGLQDIYNCCVTTEEIADFILSDRRRIVKQISVLRQEIKASKIDSLTKKYVLSRLDETLRLSGVQDE